MVDTKRDPGRWVRLIMDRRMTPDELNRFTAYLHARARRHLARQNTRALAHFALSGYSAEDAACLLIENLVLPKGGVPCWNIYRSLHALPASSAEAMCREPEDFLVRLIAVSSRDTLHRIYAEWDSAYARVRRAVESCIRTGGHYRVTHLFREKLAYRALNNLPVSKTNLCPREVLIDALHRRGRGTIGELVDSLFDFVEQRSDYSPALAMHDIAFAVREYVSGQWKSEFADCVHAEDRLLACDIGKIKAGALRQVRIGVLERYVSTGAISEDEARKLLSAAGAQLEDIARCEKRRLYCYFAEQYPGVVYDEYRNGRRSRFEYVMHLSEEEFVRRCREYLDE